MIITAFLEVFIAILNTLLTFGGLLTVSEMPLGTDTYFVNAVGYFKTVAGFFPPLQTLLTAFIWYIGFLITLRLLALVPIVRHITTRTVMSTR